MMKNKDKPIKPEVYFDHPSIPKRIQRITFPIRSLVPILQKYYDADEDQKVRCCIDVREAVESIGHDVEMLAFSIQLSGMDGAEAAAKMVEDSYQQILKIVNRGPYTSIEAEFQGFYIHVGDYLQLMDFIMSHFMGKKNGDVMKSRRKAKKVKRMPKTEHSKPLGNKKWAEIFGVSPNKMREIRRSKEYNFKQISPRLWSLPINELPAEYLAKYRQHIIQT